MGQVVRIRKKVRGKPPKGVMIRKPKKRLVRRRR